MLCGDAAGEFFFLPAAAGELFFCAAGGGDFFFCGASLAFRSDGDADAGEDAFAVLLLARALPTLAGLAAAVAPRLLGTAVSGDGCALTPPLLLVVDAVGFAFIDEGKLQPA